jgi:predicted transcriptional regulator
LGGIGAAEIALLCRFSHAGHEGGCLDISFAGGHTRTMTKLLEKAIAQARSLPPEEQDTLAAVLLAMTDQETGVVPLDDETHAKIREGLQQARRGEFASNAEVEALWKRFDLCRHPSSSQPPL